MTQNLLFLYLIIQIVFDDPRVFYIIQNECLLLVLICKIVFMYESQIKSLKNQSLSVMIGLIYCLVSRRYDSPRHNSPALS